MQSVSRHAHTKNFSFSLFKNIKTIEVSKFPTGLISFKLIVTKSSYFWTSGTIIKDLR